MRWFSIAIGVMAAAASSPASAAEYLTELGSEVFRAEGTPREIVTRASTCISQHLSAGTDSQLIISSDPDGGVIVARNALEYGSLPRWKIRSTFTFTARDGRFRIDQTNLERFNANSLTGVEAWGRIGKWTGSGWKKVEQNFAASATAVAQCVVSGPKRDDW